MLFNIIFVLHYVLVVTFICFIINSCVYSYLSDLRLSNNPDTIVFDYADLVHTQFSSSLLSVRVSPARRQLSRYHHCILPVWPNLSTLIPESGGIGQYLRITLYQAPYHSVSGGCPSYHIK